MTFLFLFRRLLHSARRTVLRRLKVLPRLPLPLLVQPDGAHPHIAVGAEHGEDGALSSRHSPEMLLRESNQCKAGEDDQETDDFDPNGLPCEEFTACPFAIDSEDEPRKQQDKEWLSVANNRD